MTMKRILIVDDQALVLRVVKLGLEGGGYEVDTAIERPGMPRKACASHSRTFLSQTSICRG